MSCVLLELLVVFVVTRGVDLLQACLSFHGSLNFANHFSQWSRYIFQFEFHY